MPENLLYRQTVTIYHAENGAVARTVVPNVFWQRGRRRMPGGTGTRDDSALLLVIPETSARWGVDYTLVPGDRVFPGEGPELDLAGWGRFVPALTETAVVEYVTPMTLRGAPHHVEAGGWWTDSGTGAHSLTN